MRGAERARQRDLLWRDPDPIVPPRWPDRSVRRLLGLAFPVAHGALVDLLGTRRVVHARQHSPGGLRRRGGGWLELADVPESTMQAECRSLGTLHVGRFGRIVPVEVVLAPWSRTRSELRLQLHRGLNVPARYFDVAHPVLDNLRDEIQSRVDALIEHASAPVRF